MLNRIARALFRPLRALRYALSGTRDPQKPPTVQEQIRTAQERMDLQIADIEASLRAVARRLPELENILLHRVAEVEGSVLHRMAAMENQALTAIGRMETALDVTPLAPFKVEPDETAPLRLATGRPAPQAMTPLTNIAHVGGKCYVAPLPKHWPLGDSARGGSGVQTLLLENGRALGPGHAMHADIEERGGGLFSHWENALYFSTSDGTDPRTNYRQYHVVMDRAHFGALWRREVNAAFNALDDEYTKEEAYTAVESALKAVYPEAVVGDHGALFWQDAQFTAKYAQLVGSNRRSMERKFSVLNLIKLLDDVNGDFAECGAYNGGTAYFMAEAAETSGRRRAIHLFDSFEGLSAPTDVDGTHWYENALAVPEEAARRNMAGFEDVHFYKGWIPERFHEVADRRFAFVHIDVDIYQPTRDSIEFFYPRLSRGGLLVCDDYGWIQCPGATKAVDEFFANTPERVVHLPTGQAVVMKR